MSTASNQSINQLSNQLIDQSIDQSIIQYPCQFFNQPADYITPHHTSPPWLPPVNYQWTPLAEDVNKLQLPNGATQHFHFAYFEFAKIQLMTNCRQRCHNVVAGNVEKALNHNFSIKLPQQCRIMHFSCVSTTLYARIAATLWKYVILSVAAVLLCCQKHVISQWYCNILEHNCHNDVIYHCLNVSCIVWTLLGWHMCTDGTNYLLFNGSY